MRAVGLERAGKASPGGRDPTGWLWEEREAELQAAGAAWAKTCSWVGEALGGRMRLDYEEPGQHCLPKSDSRTGDPSQCCRRLILYPKDDLER